jgi:hypothetical protein
MEDMAMTSAIIIAGWARLAAQYRATARECSVAITIVRACAVGSGDSPAVDRLKADRNEAIEISRQYEKLITQALKQEA